MAKDPLKVVRDNLKDYADRGVFQGFCEEQERKTKACFSFMWLTPRRMQLIVDTGKGTLTFRDLLPNVPSKSVIQKDIKRFLQERYDDALPEHRRVDSKRGEIACTNRHGVLSLSLKVRNEQYRYCLIKIVNLTHELFVHLGDYHDDYMCQNFEARQE
jgi:hypothetical protein